MTRALRLVASAPVTASIVAFEVLGLVIRHVIKQMHRAAAHDHQFAGDAADPEPIDRPGWGPGPTATPEI